MCLFSWTVQTCEKIHPQLAQKKNDYVFPCCFLPGKLPLYQLVKQTWVMELHYKRQDFTDFPGPMDPGLVTCKMFSPSLFPVPHNNFLFIQVTSSWYTHKQFTASETQGKNPCVFHTLPTDFVCLCCPCISCVLWCLYLKFHRGGTVCVCVHSTWHSGGSQLCAPELQIKHVFNLSSIDSEKCKEQKETGAQMLVDTITQHSQRPAAMLL